jgi:hypothetical protein
LSGRSGCLGLGFRWFGLGLDLDRLSFLYGRFDRLDFLGLNRFNSLGRLPTTSPQQSQQQNTNNYPGKSFHCHDFLLLLKILD